MYMTNIEDAKFVSYSEVCAIQRQKYANSIYAGNRKVFTKQWGPLFGCVCVKVLQCTLLLLNSKQVPGIQGVCYSEILLNKILKKSIPQIKVSALQECPLWSFYCKLFLAKNTFLDFFSLGGGGGLRELESGSQKKKKHNPK